MTEEQKLPYDVERYISEEQRAECENNQADHRPTSNATLAGIRERTIAKHNAYQEWLRSGTEEEQKERHKRMRWCTQVHEYFQKQHQGYTGYDSQKPTSMKLEGTWMLAPKSLYRWDDVEALRKIFLEGDAK